MIANVVASYLKQKNLISEEQYDAFFEETSKVRVKLGLIAVHEGLMTEYQADTVNMLQATMDKRFGDLAVEKGFLTDNQVNELLKKQGDPYLSVAQALDNIGIMKLPELDALMMKYRVENEMSASSIEALKSDDMDRIVPLYLPSDAEIYEEVVVLAIKTLLRCVDNNIMLEKGFYTYELPVDNCAMQFVDGDPCLTTCFAAKSDGLLYVAQKFGQEDFEKVDEDALDAVAELINCVNGLFASARSMERIQMELYPPEYSASAKSVYDAEMLVIPAIIKGKKINLAFSIGERLKISM